MRNKKTRIVTESSTTSFLILRDSKATVTHRGCDGCSADVIWLRPQAAAELTGLTPAGLYRLLETGSVHTEAWDDDMQICLPSLLKNCGKR